MSCFRKSILTKINFSANPLSQKFIFPRTSFLQKSIFQKSIPPKLNFSKNQFFQKPISPKIIFPPHPEGLGVGLEKSIFPKVGVQIDFIEGSCCWAGPVLFGMHGMNLGATAWPRVFVLNRNRNRKVDFAENEFPQKSIFVGIVAENFPGTCREIFPQSVCEDLPWRREKFPLTCPGVFLARC